MSKFGCYFLDSYFVPMEILFYSFIVFCMVVTLGVITLCCLLFYAWFFAPCNECEKIFFYKFLKGGICRKCRDEIQEDRNAYFTEILEDCGFKQICNNTLQAVQGLKKMTYYTDQQRLLIEDEGGEDRKEWFKIESIKDIEVIKRGFFGG